MVINSSQLLDLADILNSSANLIEYVGEEHPPLTIVSGIVQTTVTPVHAIRSVVSSLRDMAEEAGGENTEIHINGRNN